MAAWYAYIFPLGLILGLGALFVNYWCIKYLLLRRNTRPTQQLGGELAHSMRKILELTMVIACYGAWDFDRKIHVEKVGLEGWYTLSTFWALVLSVVLGIVLQAIFGYKQQNVISKNTMKYKEASRNFLEDYDRLNPVNAEEAKKRWLEMMYDTSKDEQEKTAFKNILQTKNTMDIKEKLKSPRAGKKNTRLQITGLANYSL